MIEEILAAEAEAEGTDLADADANSDNSVTQEELEAMTVIQLRALASSLGIKLTKVRKAEIIAELLDGAESIEVPQDNPGIDVDISG